MGILIKCSECGAKGSPGAMDGVHSYRDGETGKRVNLCPACYHDAVRSGADLT